MPISASKRASIMAAAAWALTACGGSTAKTGSTSGSATGAGGSSAGSTGAASSSGGTTGSSGWETGGSTGSTGHAGTGSSGGSSTASTGAGSSSGGSTSAASSTGGSTGLATSSGSGSSTGSSSGGSTPSSSGASGTGGSTGAASTSGGSSGGSTGAACQNDPGCTIDGQSFCAPDAGTPTIVSCALGADGCLHATDQACQSDQLCNSNGTAAGCACNDGCFAAGPTCVGNGLAQCTVNSADGCYDLGAATACASPQTCQGSNGNAACACPATTSTPKVGAGCAVPDTLACDPATGNIDICTASGPCFVWTGAPPGSIGDCSAASLVCITSGNVSCGCPARTTGAVYVDSVQGNDFSGIAPTGVAFDPTGVLDPPQCRFGTLTHALQVVFGGGTVVAVAGTPSSPMVFTGQAGRNSETFPLLVPGNVTLTTTDSPPNPADVVIAFDDSSASNAILLAGNLQGVTVRNAGGNLSNAFVSCTSGAPTLAQVTLEALGSQPSPGNYGLSIGGSCAPKLTGLTATDFAIDALVMQSTGLAIESGGSYARNATTLDLSQGTFSSSGATITSPYADAVVVAGGTLDATGLQITGAVANGLNLSGGMTTLTDCKVTGSGQNDVTLSGGTFAAYGSAFDGSTSASSAGLFMSAGSATLSTDASSNGCAFDGNAGNGITVAGGSVDATSVDASGNGGHGVEVLGGSTITLRGGTLGNGSGNAVDGLFVAAPPSTSVALHGVSLLGNRSHGLELPSGNGATVTVDGASTIAGSVGSNVRAAAGTLTMTASGGAVSVTRAGGAGLELVGAAVSLTSVTVANNGTSGVDVDDGSGGSIGLYDCTIESNLADGLTVHQTPPSGGMTLLVSGGTIESNLTGVRVVGDTGSVAMEISGATVAHDHETGVILGGAGGTSSVAMLNDTVKYNGVATLAPGSAAGGVSFLSGVTGLFFTGNVVAGNGGDQIGFSAPLTVALNGAAGSCAAQNQIYCYANGGVGLAVYGGSNASSIDASNNAWAHQPPTGGVDYSTAGTPANVTATGCNLAPTSCPAP